MPELASEARSKDAARAPAAAAKPAPGPVVGFGGMRMYRMRNGSWIKLPEDMTAQQAAQLEADGAAAEKRLGKGPAPRPVPDVKKPAKKAEVKEPHKRRRGRGAGARGKAAAKAAAAAAAALLGAVGKSKVAQYFASKALPVLTRGIVALGRLKENEQTHDDAGEKLRKSEDAVVIPPSENQSKSNAGQVDTVAERPAPVVEEKNGKQTLQESLADNLPRNIEAADNFQRDKKAQHMGSDVLKVVQGDKNAVIGTFGAMTQTPPPAPPERAPVELPPVETAPRTPPMNLAQNSLPPFLKEHIDMSGYTQQADQRLKEEGVTQEQLDMVDGGELAEANKEKKGMEVKAKTEPLAAQQFQRQEAVQLETDLAKEEKAGREAMQGKRRAGLNNTAQKQKGAKSALEKKRDEVAAEINDIYQKAQQSVTRKLESLEKDSMKRFDDGNALAARKFEDTVKLELDAYKADRYSGWFGWARKAKDWLLGMDELPRVKAIFDNNRAIFVSAIDRLVESIAADQKRVIQECKDELADARGRIQKFVDGLEPALKGIGKKTAGEMEDKLGELDQFVGDKEKEQQTKLKNKQTDAIKAIDQKIEKMKEAMSGMLAKIGRLLLWAAKKFFSWALGKFGVSLGTIESIIDKGVAVLKAIFTGPIRFVKHLIGAAMLGFKNFGKNFLTHLGNAVFAWLTGSLEGVRLPESWGVTGIVSVALQLAGISWQRIKARLLKLIPPLAVETLETGFGLVKTLISEGPMAAWEEIKDIAGDIAKAFKDEVSAWIKRRIIEEAIKTVALMFIPGAGMIRAIIAIYDTIVFFIQKAKEIIEMIGRFLGAIAEIAAGNIAAGADALEQGLALGLKLVIAFLAKLIKLDKVTGAIRLAIEKIQHKTEPVIDKVANWVVAMAKKAGKLAAGAVAKIFSWARFNSRFKDADGESHTIYVDAAGGKPRLMIASSPQAAAEFLKWYLGKQTDKDFKTDNAAKIKAVETAISVSQAAVLAVEKAQAGGKTSDKEMEDLQRALLEKNVTLSDALRLLIGDDRSIGKAREKYKLEGLTGTFGSMPKPPGDYLTADHQPQAAILEAAVELDYFTETGQMVKRAATRAKLGFAINLYKMRHEEGRTFGGKGKTTKDQFLQRVKNRITPKMGKAAQRNVVISEIKDDLLGPKGDVTVMKKVANQAAASFIWKDVMDLGGAKKNKKDNEALVDEIRKRILAGEDQIAAQDLDSLTS